MVIIAAGGSTAATRANKSCGMPFTDTEGIARSCPARGICGLACVFTATVEESAVVAVGIWKGPPA